MQCVRCSNPIPKWYSFIVCTKCSLDLAKGATVILTKAPQRSNLPTKAPEPASIRPKPDGRTPTRRRRGRQGRIAAQSSIQNTLYVGNWKNSVSPSQTKSAAKLSKSSARRLESLRRGLEQAKAGDLRDLGSFARFAQGAAARSRKNARRQAEEKRGVNAGTAVAAKKTRQGTRRGPLVMSSVEHAKECGCSDPKGYHTKFPNGHWRHWLSPTNDEREDMNDLLWYGR